MKYVVLCGLLVLSGCYSYVTSSVTVRFGDCVKLKPNIKSFYWEYEKNEIYKLTEVTIFDNIYYGDIITVVKGENFRIGSRVIHNYEISEVVECPKEE